jgi:hypothetical protein
VARELHVSSWTSSLPPRFSVCFAMPFLCARWLTGTKQLQEARTRDVWTPRRSQLNANGRHAVHDLPTGVVPWGLRQTRSCPTRESESRCTRTHCKTAFPVPSIPSCTRCPRIGTPGTAFRSVRALRNACSPHRARGRRGCCGPTPFHIRGISMPHSSVAIPPVERLANPAPQPSFDSLLKTRARC